MSNGNLLKSHIDFVAQSELSAFIASRISLEDNISMEGFLDWLADQIRNVNNRYTAVLNKIQSVFVDYKMTELGEINDTYKKSIKFVENNKYSAIEHLYIPTLTGIKIDFLEANKILEEGFKLINENVVNELSKTSDVVSKANVDEDFRKSLKKSDRDNKMLVDLTKSLKTLLDRMIDPNSREDKRTVGQMLPNLSSYSTAASDLNKISKNIDMGILKSSSIYVKNIEELIDIFISKKDIKEFIITKEALENLATRVEVTADLIGLTSTFYYIIKTQINSLSSVLNLKIK